MHSIAARLRFRLPGTAVVACLSLALVGCGEGGSGGADDGLEVVPLGYIGPLSGGAAYYGRNVERGLEMAVDEIAEAGGFEVDGRQVRFELVTADDRYLPYETATAATHATTATG